MEPFSRSELITTDISTAEAFYAQQFGWTLEDMPLEGMTYTVIKVGNLELGGVMATPPEVEAHLRCGVPT